MAQQLGKIKSRSNLLVKNREEFKTDAETPPKLAKV